MKRVYYRGKSFPCKVLGNAPGQRLYMLYKNGVLTHFVEEGEIEKRSILKTVFDFYYKGVMYNLESRW